MEEGLLFGLAAVLYLCAISAGFIQWGLRRWSVSTFAVALAIDTFATVYVCIIRAKVSIWPETFHGAMGYLALFIMAVHFVWALFSLRGGLSKKCFHWGSPFAAAIWIFAFVSGIPK